MSFPHHTIDSAGGSRAATLSTEKQFGAVPEAVALLASSPHLLEFTDTVTSQGVPPDVVKLLRYLFGEALDGRNVAITDGVRQALGREPKDFTDFARETARADGWAAA